MRYLNRFLLLAVLSGITQSVFAQSFSTRIVADSLCIPWEITMGPADMIYFTQKNGYICRLNPATEVVDTIYHEASTSINGEGGMLGMAIGQGIGIPEYIHLFVAYNYATGGLYKERIVRYTYDFVNDQMVGTPAIILDSIPAASIHDGCRLMVYQDHLFITTGDAADQPSAQDVTSLSGKVLRLNQDGSIPIDNPLPGNPVWSWGHRNAQGMVAAGGRIFISEHGPDSDDEVNLVLQGANYGWPTVKGFCDESSEIVFCDDNNVVEPLKTWTPTLAVCGLDFYNAPMFPTLQNSLLMATLKDEHLYQLKLSAMGYDIVSTTVLPGISFGRLRDLCIAQDGRIYLSTSNSNANGNAPFIDRIIELYSSTSVSETRDWRGLRLFPNPAASRLALTPEGFGQGALQWRITDARGGTVMSGTLPAAGQEIAIATLPAGLYFAQVWDAARPGLTAATRFEKR